MIGPYDPHAELDPNARLLMLLPLLRTTAAVVLLETPSRRRAAHVGIEVDKISKALPGCAC